MWVSLGYAFGWFGACALVWARFIWYPWLWSGLPLPGLWVWLYVVGELVGLYVRSGLDCFSFARGVGLVIFGWYAYWQLFLFVVG